MYNNNGFYIPPIKRINRFNENNMLNKNKNIESFEKELKNIDNMTYHEIDDFFNKYIVKKIFPRELSTHNVRVCDDAKMIFLRIINDSSKDGKNINTKITRIKKLFTYIKTSKRSKTYPNENNSSSSNNTKLVPGQLVNKGRH